MLGHFWKERMLREGLIDAVGGLSDALNKLHEMISDRNQKKNENV